jgi:hypothetical protein
MAHLEADLSQSLLHGGHFFRGVKIRDIRSRLTTMRRLRACTDDPKGASTEVGRRFRRLHAHGRIPKTMRSRQANLCST